MNNKVFYQHPNLMRALGMHETVMQVMVSVLGGGETKVSPPTPLPPYPPPHGVADPISPPVSPPHIQEIRFPKMVTNCCRFLCYFCRISRQNQRSMFDHLGYLLENSSIGLGGGPRVSPPIAPSPSPSPHPRSYIPIPLCIPVSHRRAQIPARVPICVSLNVPTPYPRPHSRP